jgi:hypothetical protein
MGGMTTLLNVLISIVSNLMWNMLQFGWIISNVLISIVSNFNQFLGMALFNPSSLCLNNLNDMLD